MPPLSAHGRYLVAILNDVGPVSPMGMGGVVAISESELMAWQVNQAIRLAPWECRLVRRMSKEYAAMAGAATKPDCPMPWIPVGDDVRSRVAEQIKSVFSGLRRAG